jgi:hypothetical protein
MSNKNLIQISKESWVNPKSVAFIALTKDLETVVSLVTGITLKSSYTLEETAKKFNQENLIEE